MSEIYLNFRSLSLVNRSEAHMIMNLGVSRVAGLGVISSNWEVGTPIILVDSLYIVYVYIYTYVKYMYMYTYIYIYKVLYMYICMYVCWRLLWNARVCFGDVSCPFGRNLQLLPTSDVLENIRQVHKLPKLSILAIFHGFESLKGIRD